MTDLRETIAIAVEGMDTSDVDACRDVADAIIRALPGAVVPLVWHKRTARTPISIYTVGEETNDDEPFFFVYINSKSAGKLGEHNTLEAAKSAAEAHHRAGIMAALGVTEDTEGGESE